MSGEMREGPRDTRSRAKYKQREERNDDDELKELIWKNAVIRQIGR